MAKSNKPIRQRKNKKIQGSGLWDTIKRKIENFIIKYNPLSMGIKHALKDSPTQSKLYNTFENKLTN